MYFLTMVLVLIANLAQATTYYVATTGSNSNNGTDLSTPFRTINKCAQLLVAGDTCYVRGGTYTESGGVLLDSSGTQSAPIKLLAYPGENPVISFPAHVNTNRIVIANASGTNVAMGWITISGFEVQGGWEGIKFHNLHNSVISNNWFHDGENSGIFGVGGHHVLFERNIFSHNGNWTQCAAGTQTCDKVHGLYAHGDSYTVRNNLFYDNIGGGIQVNGAATSLYTTARHPSPEFSGGSNWIIESNTFAYQHYASGIILWGNTNNTRVENNILYENRSDATSSQAIFFTGNGMSGVSIKNNHAYASGSGGTAFIGALSTSPITEGVQYTQSGNVVNVSPPAFVNGGSNSLPASPDFRLTASAPVNIALANEFLNNSTSVVGAYKTVGTPIASITTNKITITFPMSTAVPIQIPSATGVSIGCTGANCPGSPAVVSASRKTGTDSQVEVVISGIASDACVATNQNWTISYDSSTGGWTGFDDIGAYQGQSQNIFSFTNLAVTNNCDGTGPGGVVGTPFIAYNFNDGSGVSVANSGSSGTAYNGTLSNGPPWVPGKTGTAVLVEAGTNQKIDVPHGSAIDPTTTTVMWVLAVNVPSGSETVTHFVIGPSLGTNQRAYLCGHAGTWRISIQGTACQSRPASNLTVDAGYNFLTVTFNSSTDVVTVTKNSITGTGGATAAYTPFAFASNVTIGRLNENSGSGLTIDYFAWYTTAEDPVELYDAWSTPTVSIGTFGMPSYRFQAVYLPELGGSPTNFGTAINQAKTVIAGGAVALLAEIYCENVIDCERDSFRWVARQNGTGSYLQIPDMETDTHIWMWGADANTLLNSGTTTSRLSAGSCTATNGVTMLTSAQVPSIDLPQDGCVVLRGIFRIGTTASGYYDIQLQQQSGTAFTGTVNPARITIVAPQASAGP